MGTLRRQNMPNGHRKYPFGNKIKQKCARLAPSGHAGAPKRAKKVTAPSVGSKVSFADILREHVLKDLLFYM